MSFLYNKKLKILHQSTRVIETEVVNFYIVKKTSSYLGGLIEFNSNELRSDYNSKNVPDDLQYKIEMGVKAAGYSILQANWKLMLDHEK